MKQMSAILIAFLLTFVSRASAVEYRVEAAEGKAQALIDSGSLVGGDRLILGPGPHGKIVISGFKFDRPVIITSEDGAPPEVDQLVIENSAGWRIEGLTIIPRTAGKLSDALVKIHSGRHIHLDHLIVASAQDSNAWTAEKWRNTARKGITLSGQDISITNSIIRNVRHGISSSADRVRIEKNIIELFSGDGIRGLGNNSDYIGNTIKTCVRVDDNHDDGFQSWSLDSDGRPGKGTVRNVRVEGNLIRNGNHPLTCRLQGIGLFDGIYENWVIRANTVIVDSWHGITVMGARGVVISENKVLDSRPGKPGAPWISITAHKDGRIAEDSVIERNVTLPWAGGQNSPFKQPQPGVELYGNRTVETPEDALRQR